MLYTLAKVCIHTRTNILPKHQIMRTYTYMHIIHLHHTKYFVGNPWIETELTYFTTSKDLLIFISSSSSQCKHCDPFGGITCMCSVQRRLWGLMELCWYFMYMDLKLEKKIEIIQEWWMRGSVRFDMRHYEYKVKTTLYSVSKQSAAVSEKLLII